MTERDRTVRAIFDEAVVMSRPRRAALLEARCGSDPALRREVELLLAHDADRPDDFLDGARVDLRAAAENGEDLAQIFPSAAPGAGPAAALPLPARIGAYRVKRMLGMGGMGVVYLAAQESPRREVAIKVMRSGLMSRELLKRFELEAAMLGRLQHPGIAQIYEAGTHDDGSGARPYFAMEYIAGPSLSAYVREGSLDQRQRIETMIRICAAVEHAHQRGIIHRDLKPANVLVDRSGQPKVLDFGVARATESDLQVTTLQTAADQLVGTVAYMSPEQVRGRSGDIDTRSDVYALGLMLYELLADRLPYDLVDLSIAAAARVIAETEPTRLTTVDRRDRGDLDTIARKALEKDPERRYDSAAALAADLRRFLDDEPILARPATATYQLRKFSRRNKGLVAGAAAAVVMLVTGVVVSLVFAMGQSRALAESEQQRRIAEAVNEFLNVGILAQGNPRVTDAGHRGDPDLTLREVTERAASGLETRFAGQPRVEASIRDVLGQTYFGLEDPVAAEAQFRRSLALWKEHAGPHDPAALAALACVGVAQNWSGRPQDAAATLRESLAGHEAALGPEHLDTLEAAYALSWVLRRLGQLDEAEALAARAYDGKLRLAGPRDRGTLSAGTALAMIRADRGDLAAAAELLGPIVDVSRETFGHHHYYAISARVYLAGVLRRQRRLDEAEHLAREALRDAQEGLGADHPKTLQAMVTLGAVLRDHGQRAEAGTLYRDVLQKRERIFGTAYVDTISSRADLAYLLYCNGNYEEAEAEYRTIIDWRLKHLGPDHPKTLLSRTSLADAVWRQGRRPEAEAIHRSVLERRTAVLGARHPATLSSMTRVGVLCLEAGALDEADTWLTRALALRREVLGPDHPKTLWTLHNLATVAFRRDAGDRAESLLREDLALQRRIKGEAHSRTWAVIEMLVDLYDAQGRFAEADGLLRDTRRIRVDAFGAESPEVAVVTEALTARAATPGDSSK